MKKDRKAAGNVEDKRSPYRISLPGFVTDEELGLGDAVKRATSYFGIKPCGGCESRANALNRWMVLTNKGTKGR